jgi:hypothetical protein
MRREITHIYAKKMPHLYRQRYQTIDLYNKSSASSFKGPASRGEYNFRMSISYNFLFFRLKG